MEIVGLVILLVIAYFALSAVVGTAMGIVGLIIPILIWMASGFIAGKLVRGEGYSPLMNIGLGLGGGIIGTLALNVVGLGWVDDVRLFGSVIAGVIGAIILIYALRLFGKQDFGR